MNIHTRTKHTYRVSTLCKYTYIYVYTHTHKPTYTKVPRILGTSSTLLSSGDVINTYIHAYTNTHGYIYIYIYTHTHTYIHIQTYIHTGSSHSRNQLHTSKQWGCHQRLGMGALFVSSVEVLGLDFHGIIYRCMYVCMYVYVSWPGCFVC